MASKTTKFTSKHYDMEEYPENMTTLGKVQKAFKKVSFAGLDKEQSAQPLKDGIIGGGLWITQRAEKDCKGVLDLIFNGRDRFPTVSSGHKIIADALDAYEEYCKRFQ